MEIRLGMTPIVTRFERQFGATDLTDNQKSKLYEHVQKALNGPHVKAWCEQVMLHAIYKDSFRRGQDIAEYVAEHTDLQPVERDGYKAFSRAKGACDDMFTMDQLSKLCQFFERENQELANSSATDLGDAIIKRFKLKFNETKHDAKSFTKPEGLPWRAVRSVIPKILLSQEDSWERWVVATPRPTIRECIDGWRAKQGRRDLFYQIVSADEARAADEIRRIEGTVEVTQLAAFYREARSKP